MSNQSLIRERVVEREDNESVRAAIYVRTSTTNQDYGYSLDEQLKQCADRCQSLGWQVVFIYRDQAESGKNTDRPMFQEMRRTAEKDAFDVLVFWKLDRLSRSLIHTVQLESELRDHDVALYSVTEQIDTTTATGRFNFRNIASAAEFERDMIQQRTEMGINAMAEQYKWPNDTSPLGYEITDDGKLSIVQDEKELVTQIFEWYIELQSMPDVAAKLNDKGIRTQENGEWTQRAVGDILRNEIYRGQYELGDVSEHVPEYQIIDDEMFEEVTSIRMRFQKKGTSKSPMPNSRKEKAIQEVREAYSDYLESCR